MTNKDFKEGMSISCEINGIKIDNAKLHLEDGSWYICHNVEDEDECCSLENSWGYKCNFEICDDWTEGDYNVTNIQPKHRTIDDLECGDYVVDESGWKRKCLGVCGEVYAMSSNWKKTVDNSDKIDGGWWTIYQLKKCGYTLCQPEEVKETHFVALYGDNVLTAKEETDIDKCIEIANTTLETLNKIVNTIDESVKTFFNQADELINKLKK